MNIYVSTIKHKHEDLNCVLSSNYTFVYGLEIINFICNLDKTEGFIFPETIGVWKIKNRKL